MLFAGTLALAAHAQADDPLPLRVGRLASVQGALYHSATGDHDEDWVPIGLNYPVAQGDNLWADHDARAEVDYGGGQFRLAGDTNLHVSRLDERQLALFVASGRVIVRVRYLQADDSVRVDTPATQIALERPGLYRIDVDATAQQTTLLVREGEAEIATSAGAKPVLPGQRALFSAAANTADIRAGGGLDAFDTWSAARDRVYEQSRENAYVSREMVGQTDLDAHGQWQAYPEYGAVWFPTVDPDWAPYRFGRWTWLPGFGYTWVDSAPWGYAPFHYGRWAYIGGRWGWCPGAFVARPSWAPALVAWYDDRSLAGAPVYGWVPLGWGEPYVPAWRGCGARCYARYNRPYAVNVAERPGARPTRYANWTVPGGATAVPAGTLAGGRPVASDRVPLPAYRAVAPALATAPPAVKPAPVRPGAVRAGNGIPLPAAVTAARATRAASLPPVVSSSGSTPLPALAPPPAAHSPALPAPAARTEPALAPVPATRTAPALAPVPATRTVPPTAPGSAAPTVTMRPLPSLVAPALPERTVRPVPVPPSAPAPAPIRVPAPAMPLPRMPAPPVPGVSPAPPAAIVPAPPRAPAPTLVAPAPRAPAPAPAAPVAPVAPVAPRPPGVQN